MSTQIAIEILLIFLLVVANGIFAMAEIPVVSSRKARLRTRADEGDRRAAVTLELADNPNDFLSTVQIGITLVGILAGVFGGATVTEQLAQRLNRVALIAPHGESLAIAIVVLGITYLSLVVGELVPKRIALTAPERVAGLLAPMMKRLSRLARPAVWGLTVSTSAVVKLLRIPQSQEPAVTEEELTSMLELGRRTGEFHPAEEEMIRGVFDLGDRTARSVMTPRVDVVWLDLTKSAEVLRKTIVESGFTRFPAAERSLDHFLGIVDVKDLLASAFAGTESDLREVVQEPLVFPETTSVLTILREFQSRKAELGVVVDEYGGFEGIVTVSDLAMRVLGLEDEEQTMVRRQDGSWLVDAGMDFADVARALKLRVDDATAYETVAGFLIAHLKKFPRVGDSVTVAGCRLEVVDMDGQRIDKILISVLTTE